MIYIEAPIGVGFSYSDDPEEYAVRNQRDEMQVD